MATLSGGGEADKYLADLATKIGEGRTLRVGFLEGAKYPDGTPVAYVAALNNFGHAPTPPRPFFTNMIRENWKSWGDVFTAALAATENDFAKALGILGEVMGGELQLSIQNTFAPALSPITLMLRKMKRLDQGLIVTGSVVGEAARRVAAGESYAGENTHPLIDTNHMVNSVAYEVTSDGDVTIAYLSGESAA